MIIVNLKEFLAMPKGTVFSKYDEGSFRGWKIKAENCGKRDFFVYEIDPICITADGSDHLFDSLDDAKKGIDQEMDFDTLMRDGLFNDDQMFAIYTDEDVSRLIKVLKG